MKDGQAVFTNLEKCYIYRYIFAKGIESQKKNKFKRRTNKQNSRNRYKKICMSNAKR